VGIFDIDHIVTSDIPSLHSMVIVVDSKFSDHGTTIDTSMTSLKKVGYQSDNEPKIRTHWIKMNS
jgi:hypothetical protein